MGKIEKATQQEKVTEEAQKTPSHRIRMKGLDIKRPQNISSNGQADKVELKKENMSELLKTFMEEHKTMIKVIEEFEKRIIEYKVNGYDLKPEINTAFSKFFKCVDEELLPHSRKEEKVLFSHLNKKLAQAKQYITNDKKITAVDVMEDDHIKFIQLGTLSFNLLGLATRMADERSKFFVLDTAYDTSREFIELIKLHFYREEETVFPLAQKYISEEEFEMLQKEMINF